MIRIFTNDSLFMITLRNNEELQFWVNKSHGALMEIENILTERKAGQLTVDEYLERVEAQLSLFKNIQQQIAWIIDEIMNERLD